MLPSTDQEIAAARIEQDFRFRTPPDDVTLPFLTDIDPRAKVLGSRDALGVVPLWSHFGRHVVGNLTTVSTSPRGFTTLLLGYYFARAAQERAGEGPELLLPSFLRFEQLASYCRWHVNSDGDFRGIERVRSRLEQGSGVRISAELRDQTLASQKTYGLWGLYSNAARSSGWLEAQESILTPTAQEFVETRYLPRLEKVAGRDGAKILQLLTGQPARLRLEKRHRPLAQGLAQVLSPEFSREENDFYWHHLVEGGPADATGGLQPAFARLVFEHFRDEPEFNRKVLRSLIQKAVKAGGRLDELADRLSRIDHLESLLVPASSAFGFLLSRKGGKLEAIAGELATAWKDSFASLDLDAIGALEKEIAESYGDADTGRRWTEFARALKTSDYSRFVRLLLDQNAFVLRSRNGSDPWARVVRGRLEVRFRDESFGLVPRSELSSAWRSNFFLNPLQSMVHTLRGTW